MRSVRMSLDLFVAGSGSRPPFHGYSSREFAFSLCRFRFAPALVGAHQHALVAAGSGLHGALYTALANWPQRLLVSRPRRCRNRCLGENPEGGAFLGVGLAAHAVLLSKLACRNRAISNPASGRIVRYHRSAQRAADAFLWVVAMVRLAASSTPCAASFHNAPRTLRRTEYSAGFRPVRF